MTEKQIIDLFDSKQGIGCSLYNYCSTKSCTIYDYYLTKDQLIENLKELGIEIVEEIKPCPFCGSTDIYEILSEHTGHRCYCTKCHADCGYSDTKEEAIKKWNTRK